MCKFIFYEMILVEEITLKISFTDFIPILHGLENQEYLHKIFLFVCFSENIISPYKNILLLLKCIYKSCQNVI